VPRILITNDDGVHAPGLLALKQALEVVGEVIVFAPDHNWSGAGHTKTLHKPLWADQITLADGSKAYASSGAPSDCVALALLGVVREKIDLVVSGINPGMNVGDDVTYSGTVAGAMEAVVNGVPGIAVSLNTIIGSSQGVDFMPAARAAARIAAQVLQQGLPPGVLLNINVPLVAERDMRGVQVTRLGRRIYRDVLIERADPRGRPYYWIGGDPPTGHPDEGTDIGAVESGFISVTPLNMDMTDFSFSKQLASWKFTQE
jgi:5'-nucleotidase